MSLTIEERRAAARCAYKYPRGWGSSFFSHIECTSAATTAYLLANQPDRVVFG